VRLNIQAPFLLEIKFPFFSQSGRLTGNLTIRPENSIATSGLCVPKMAIAGVDWVAHVKDPDGNIFGMMQMDASAG
jgi:hypothetical protein